MTPARLKNPRLVVRAPLWDWRSRSARGEYETPPLGTAVGAAFVIETPADAEKAWLRR